MTNNNKDLTEDEIADKLLNAKMRQLSLASMMGYDLPKDDNKQVEKQTGEKNVLPALTLEGYFGGIAMTVLDNLQIFIDNVHFRYEDSESNPDSLFSVGLTVESIHVQSTNELWEPCFDAAIKELMNKVFVF